MTTEWFFSKSGQQQGPVSTEQLKQLAASGQLHPGDLVLKDGMGQWVEARKIKGLFPAQPMSSPQGPHNSPQPEATPPQWFFSNAGQQQGPVSAEQLKQLAGEGRLLPSDLVWKEGMAQWAEAKNIEGLFPPPPLPPAAIAGPPPMPAAAPAGPAVSSSPQMPAHAAVFQPQSLAEPFATVESQPFDFSGFFLHQHTLPLAQVFQESASEEKVSAAVASHCHDCLCQYDSVVWRASGMEGVRGRFGSHQ